MFFLLFSPQTPKLTESCSGLLFPFGSSNWNYINVKHSLWSVASQPFNCTRWRLLLPFCCRTLFRPLFYYLCRGDVDLSKAIIIKGDPFRALPRCSHTSCFYARELFISQSVQVFPVSHLNVSFNPPSSEFWTAMSSPLQCVQKPDQTDQSPGPKESADAKEPKLQDAAPAQRPTAQTPDTLPSARRAKRMKCEVCVHEAQSPLLLHPSPSTPTVKLSPLQTHCVKIEPGEPGENKPNLRRRMGSFVAKQEPGQTPRNPERKRTATLTAFISGSESSLLAKCTMYTRIILV